jgi:hypothetical protein
MATATSQDFFIYCGLAWSEVGQHVALSLGINQVRLILEKHCAVNFTPGYGGSTTLDAISYCCLDFAL